MSVESIRRRLEQLAAAASAADRGYPACVWVNEGESTEKAMARWLAARPGQDPVRDGREVIFIRWGERTQYAEARCQRHGASVVKPN